MKAKPDCIVCMFNQALRTAKILTDDSQAHLKMLWKLAATLTNCDLDNTPANLSKPAYTIINEIMGVADPYKLHKEESNLIALALAKSIRGDIENADDPLDKALHAAAAGNLIDMGLVHDFNIKEDIKVLMNKGFARSEIESFRKELRQGANLLYLGDNAGEIVFDKMLIDQINKYGVKVAFSVKSGPIINDATMEDAKMVGMDQVAEVIETGSNDIGVNWESVSDDFMSHVNEADLILSKGQGNFETCNDRKENFYFLLKAKCDLVAKELEVNLGDIIFSH